MSNKIKDIDIKNHTYDFVDDNININNFQMKYVSGHRVVVQGAKKLSGGVMMWTMQ